MAKSVDIRLTDCIIYEGQRCDIGYAVRANRDMEVEAYLGSLREQEVIGLWRVLIELTKPQRVVLPKKRFRKLADEIYEVKYYTGPRVFCFKHEAVWWLTHGYTKQSQKTPDEQIERARAIRREHIARFWGHGPERAER